MLLDRPLIVRALLLTASALIIGTFLFYVIKGIATACTR